MDDRDLRHLRRCVDLAAEAVDAGDHAFGSIIVYATSTPQLVGWLEELGLPPLGIAPLRIVEVVPDAQVEGPVAAFAEEVRALHARAGG